MPEAGIQEIYGGRIETTKIYVDAK